MAEHCKFTRTYYIDFKELQRDTESNKTDPFQLLVHINFTNTLDWSNIKWIVLHDLAIEYLNSSFMFSNFTIA